MYNPNALPTDAPRRRQPAARRSGLFCSAVDARPATVRAVRGFREVGGRGSAEVSVRRGASRPASPSTRSRSAIGHVVAQHRRERLDERHAALRVELVLDPAVDDDDVAGAERLRLVADRHRHVALDDPHDLLRGRVRVPCARVVPGSYVDVAEHHLLAADRVDRHAREEGVAIHAVPRSEGRGQAGTSNRIPPEETAFTESSSSNTTFFPSRVGSAFASRARSTRSGVIGSSVTHTPTAS